MIEIWNDDGDLDLEQWVKANVLASLVSNRWIPRTVFVRSLRY